MEFDQNIARSQYMLVVKEEERMLSLFGDSVDRTMG
jgi:hypothetical protein